MLCSWLGYGTSENSKHWSSQTLLPTKRSGQESAAYYVKYFQLELQLPLITEIIRRSLTAASGAKTFGILQSHCHQAAKSCTTALTRQRASALRGSFLAQSFSEHGSLSFLILQCPQKFTLVRMIDKTFEPLSCMFFFRIYTARVTKPLLSCRDLHRPASTTSLRSNARTLSNGRD